MGSSILKFTIGTGVPVVRNGHLGERRDPERSLEAHTMINDPQMTDTEQSARVGQAQKLIAVFNRWPSFHDAQVLWACLDREDCSLRVKIYVFESTKTTTRETDDRGYFRMIQECYVTLRFERVENIIMREFNHQNIMAGLIIAGDSPIRVEIEPIFGLYGSWSCGSIEVEEVEICKAHTSAAETSAIASKS